MILLRNNMVHILMRRWSPANPKIKSKLRSNLISCTLHEAKTIVVFVAKIVIVKASRCSRQLLV
jgi:hypothetical protein